MKKNVLFLVGLLVGCARGAWAQDPQFSQFYAAPLSLNPAFAGATDVSRVVLNHRIQWPQLAATYTTTAFSLDHNFERYNSGVGLLVSTDRISASGLNSTEVGGLYSYNLKFSTKWAFRAGFQGTYIRRSIDFSKFMFNEQLSDFGPNGNPSSEFFATDNINMLSVTSGGLLYSERMWLGFAAHHLNQPNQSFMGSTSRLPMKMSVHGGYKFALGKWKRGKTIEKEQEKSLTLAANYKAQGEFDQLDAGIYANYKVMVLGVWYRGLPVKPYRTGMSNNESLIFLTGFRWKGFNLGYSYDYTLSGLAGYTGGSHELSLAYDFAFGKNAKNSRF